MAGERFLVAGCGGGFDVICALPGKTVHLASDSVGQLHEIIQNYRHQT